MMSWENPWGASRDILYRVRTLPTFLLWTVIGFMSGWVQTRRVSALLIGLPSLVIGTLVITTTLKARQGLTTETVRRYVETAQKLLKENQIEQAEFYISRLKSLDYQSDSLLVTRAEIETRRDRIDLSEICFREMLTNQDQTLNAVAHQKLAMIELKRLESPNSPQAAKAIYHFQQALLGNPTDIASHEYLARLYLAKGDIDSVIQHLEPVALQKPAVHLELARMFNKIDRKVMTVESAAKADKYFSAELAKLDTTPSQEEEPEGLKRQRFNLLLNLIEAQVLESKLDDAIKTATETLDRHQSPELRRRLAAIYIMKANSLPQVDASWSKRWELVALSRNYDPNSQDALLVLANIAANAPGKLREMATQEILPYLETGQAPPSAYSLVGTAAAEIQDWDTAAKLLRKAVEVDPQADIAWNNLAHTLYAHPQPDWIEAERCVNEAVRLNPAPPRYHETRGQIMIGLKKWPEAVRELEIARNAFPASTEIHRGLAVAYHHLGDDDLAEFHRSRVDSLTR